MILVNSRDVRGGLFFHGAGRGGVGRGKGENPRGGAGRGGAKKRVNRPIPKVLQKCVNEKI